VEQCEKFQKHVKGRGFDVFGSLSALSDASADVVFCRHAVEHLPELAPVLREMCRVARHEVLIVAGETPGTADRTSFDASRDLFWNAWGTARYADVLRSTPGVVNWHWLPQLSFQGRGGRDESILFVRLQR
jgi:SAM-dependent methyltransferase